MTWEFTKNGTWKNKSSWNQTIEHQWPFRPTDADNYYDEAYIITSDANPVWQYPFDNEANQDVHDPCGYWISSYFYYTTWTFNPHNIDELDAYAELYEGEHSYVASYIDIPFEEIECTGFDLVEGDLERVFVYYSIPVEEIEATGHDLVEGEFKNVFNYYSIDTEEIEATGHAFVEGYHKWNVRYKNWYLIIDDETLECTGFDLVEGEHSEN